jgi:hypothetical protein
MSRAQTIPILWKNPPEFETHRGSKGVLVMNSCSSRFSIWIVALITTISPGGPEVFAQDASITPPPQPAQEQLEVLNRGPVHEAFAEPVTMQTQAGLIVPVQPPAAIEEIPPAERPQGDQFVWIPGYWSWDAARLDYIWVSACWRAAPPSRSWVPGYWAQVSGGWEWVSGFWSPGSVQNVTYLPAPPAIEDLEATSVQPTPDTIWVPPCMYWINGSYVRRGGYWLAAQSDWVWVPSHYIETPRGYLFADGHWDYSLDRRGVLFAPVYFPSSVYLRAGFTFSPGIAIDLGLLRVNLFACPRYNHYYFGDYYNSTYLSIGIFPWFESRDRHTWYDPIYEHARWQHARSEPQWEKQQRDEYLLRFDNKDLRPAHTFREQESRLARLPEPQRKNAQLTQSLSVTISSRNTSIKFEQIKPDMRQKITSQAKTLNTYRDERKQWENPSPDRKTIHSTGNFTPTAVSRTQTLAQPTVRTPSPQQAETYRSTIKQPAVRTPVTQSVEPSKQAVTQPATRTPSPQQNSGYNPSYVAQPEQVQIPASPVTGTSGTSGFFFKKGPPKYPSNESNRE